MYVAYHWPFCLCIPLLNCLPCDVISDTIAVILTPEHKVHTLRVIRMVRWKNLVTKPEATSWLFITNICFYHSVVALSMALLQNGEQMKTMPMFLRLFSQPKILSHRAVIKSMVNYTEKQKQTKNHLSFLFKISFT